MLPTPSLWSELLTYLEPVRPYLEPVSWTLVHALWQGAVLAGLLALGLWLLRDRSARARYTLSVVMLAALLVLPVATVALVGMPDLTSTPAGPASVMMGAEAQTLEATLAAEALAAAPPAVGTVTRAPTTGPSWQAALPVLAAVWLLGVAVLLLRLGGSLWYVRRLRTQAVAPLPEAWAMRAQRLADRVGVPRAVRFVQSSRASVPMVIGWWRPVIVLPVSTLAGLPPAYIEAILMHELTHVRRHDALVGWLQVMAETLLFFHPATWWISRRIRIEREHCCDDRVVQLTGKRTTYARALTQLETLKPAAWHPAPAATDGSLLHRIRRILGQPVQQRLVNGWRAAAGMAATAVLGLLAAGLLLASAPATSDDTTTVGASTFAEFTLPDLTGGPAALGVSPPATHDTTDRTFTQEIVLGQDTLHLQFNDPVVEQHADSSATLRFRGEPSVRVFIRDDSLRALRAEDFAFVVDSLQQGKFAALMRGFATLGESMGTLGNGLETLMDSLNANPQAFEGRLWWEDTPGASPDTLELRSWGGLSPEERRAQLDSLMAQAHALWQPSPEQRARRDSLIAQARTLYEPSPEQQARIDSLRSRLRTFTELAPERRAQMDSLTAMLRDLHQPSAEERARVDSLMARAQALVRPTEERQAQLDSLQALISRLNQPSSEQLRQRAEVLRRQAERLEAEAQALERQTPPPPPTPPDNENR